MEELDSVMEQAWLALLASLTPRGGRGTRFLHNKIPPLVDEDPS